MNGTLTLNTKADTSTIFSLTLDGALYGPGTRVRARRGQPGPGGAPEQRRRSDQPRQRRPAGIPFYLYSPPSSRTPAPSPWATTPSSLPGDQTAHQRRQRPRRDHHLHRQHHSSERRTSTPPSTTTAPSPSATEPCSWRVTPPAAPTGAATTSPPRPPSTSTDPHLQRRGHHSRRRPIVVGNSLTIAGTDTLANIVDDDTMTVNPGVTSTITAFTLDGTLNGPGTVSVPAAGSRTLAEGSLGRRPRPDQPRHATLPAGSRSTSTAPPDRERRHPHPGRHPPLAPGDGTATNVVNDPGATITYTGSTTHPTPTSTPPSTTTAPSPSATEPSALAGNSASGTDTGSYNIAAARHARHRRAHPTAPRHHPGAGPDRGRGSSLTITGTDTLPTSIDDDTDDRQLGAHLHHHGVYVGRHR